MKVSIEGMQRELTGTIKAYLAPSFDATSQAYILPFCLCSSGKIQSCLLGTRTEQQGNEKGNQQQTNINW